MNLPDAGSIVAVGGVIGIVGGLVLQVMTFIRAGVTVEKVDQNTALTKDAAAVQATTAGLKAVIANVEQAKIISTANREVIQQVVEKVIDVAGTVSDVVGKIDAVRLTTDGLTERLAAAKLAQGIAEGHVIGVAAEQARVQGETQQLRALVDHTGNG